MGGGSSKNEKPIISQQQQIQQQQFQQQNTNQQQFQQQNQQIQQQPSIKKFYDLKQKYNIKNDINFSELGFKYLTYNSIKLISVQFHCIFDQKIKDFQIINDGSQYTICDFRYVFNKNLKVYEMHIDDQSVAGFQNDQKQSLKEDQIQRDQKLSSQFDVDEKGQFLGMPDQEKVVQLMAKLMGINIKFLSDEQKEMIAESLDIKQEQFWEGIFQRWAKLKSHDINKVEMEKKQSNIQVKSGLQINGEPFQEYFHQRMQNPQKVRAFIEQKLDTKPNFKQLIISKSARHPDVKKIPKLLERDSQFNNNKQSQKWVNGKTKFIDVDIKRQLMSKIWDDGFRCFDSEQKNERKILFVVNDEYVHMDIQTDNRLYILLWKDDLDGKINQQYIQNRIQQFQSQNKQNLDFIFNQLKSYGLF